MYKIIRSLFLVTCVFFNNVFALEVKPDTYYWIVPVHTVTWTNDAKFVSVGWGDQDIAENSTARQYGYGNGENQKFLFEPVLGTSNSYVIFMKHSLLALTVENGSTENNVDIVQSAYCNGENQQWIISSTISDSDNSECYYLIAKHSGKCLDIENGSTNNNIRVQQYEYYGFENQKYYIWEAAPYGHGLDYWNQTEGEIETTEETDGEVATTIETESVVEEEYDTDEPIINENMEEKNYPSTDIINITNTEEEIIIEEGDFITTNEGEVAVTEEEIITEEISISNEGEVVSTEETINPFDDFIKPISINVISNHNSIGFINNTIFEDKDTIRLSISVNQELNEICDAYIAIIIPDGTIAFMTDINKYMFDFPWPVVTSWNSKKFNETTILENIKVKDLPKGTYKFYFVLVKQNNYIADMNSWICHDNREILVK